MLWAGCVASAAMDEVSNAACIVRAQDETGRQTHTDTATWRRAIDVTVQVETGETLGMQKVYVSQRKGDTPFLFQGDPGLLLNALAYLFLTSHPKMKPPKLLLENANCFNSTHTPSAD